MQFVLSAYTSLIIIFCHTYYVFQYSNQINNFKYPEYYLIAKPLNELLPFHVPLNCLYFFQNRFYCCSHKVQQFASTELVFSHLLTYGFTASDKSFRMPIYRSGTHTHTFRASDSSWIATAKIIHKNNHSTINTQDVMQLYTTVPLQAQNWIMVMCSHDMVDKLMMSTSCAHPPLNAQWWR